MVTKASSFVEGVQKRDVLERLKTSVSKVDENITVAGADEIKAAWAAAETKDLPPCLLKQVGDVRPSIMRYIKDTAFRTKASDLGSSRELWHPSERHRT